ncbi:MAG: hypothetical protein RL380_343 [Verrucomicrobiota bacterium]
MSNFVSNLRIVLRSVWDNPGNRGQLLYRTARALRWQISKRTWRRARVLTLPTGARMKVYPDCHVSSAVIYADWPEYHELQFLRRQLKSGEVVVDVGANVGHLLLLLSDVVGAENLYGFEPTPLTFQRLEENWRLNQWPLKNLFNAAVGANSGTMFITNSKTPETTNSVHAQAQGDDVAVAIKTLDASAALWHGRKIGLLKIDVEGFEAQVFGGALRFLQESRPRFIMFESLGGQVESAVAESLAAARYVVFQLDQHGDLVWNRSDAQNLFAVPAENVVALKSQSA